MKDKLLNHNLTLNLNLSEEIKKGLLCRGLLVACALLLASMANAQPQPPANPAEIMRSPQPSIDTVAPVEATAVFDPPVIKPGGTSTYRVTFTAMIDSVSWPEEVIAPEQLVMHSSARGQSLTTTAMGMQPHAAFNYRTRAAAAGSFTVPRYIVYVYGRPVTVPAAKLDVVENPAPPPRSAQLLLEASNKNPFVGQMVTMRMIWPGSEGGVQPLSFIRLNGDGFWANQGVVQQGIRIIHEYGTNWSSLVGETIITPLKPGNLEVSAQGFTAGINSAGPIVITGNITIRGMGQSPVLLDSDPVTLNVRPVPREGELPGFNGAIGQFRLGAPALATNGLRVGDAVTLTVRVSGTGDLARLVAPPPPSTSGWQVYAGAIDTAPPQLIQARGFMTFSYTLIPTSEETSATPKIPFSYFDPTKAAYVDLTVPSVKVTVKAGAVPVDMAALTNAGASSTTEGEREPRLAGLALTPGRSMNRIVPTQHDLWFSLMQLAPAGILLGLWYWDRRRRFHEAHPEVMVRRRARRALRREWAAVRHAASLGDTGRFAACAVNAMRIASAPHYPAEPQALVSSDVTPLLTETGGAVSFRQVVRQIFAAADAERFAEQPEPSKDLLMLRPELERVLAQLEARL